MPTLDLGAVTKAYVELIKNVVATSPGWLPRLPPTVSPLPPEVLSGSVNAIGFHLYHVSENPSLKNQLNTAADPRVRYSAMPVTLHFQLYASSATEDDAGFYLAQLMLGLAMRALHDWPVLKDSSRPGGADVMTTAGLSGQDNSLRIHLVPMDAKDSYEFWESSALGSRLAAYYEVSVVMLEPEEAPAPGPPVLVYQPEVFPAVAAQLDHSETTVAYTDSDGVSAELLVRPAHVPAGHPVRLVGGPFIGDEVYVELERDGLTLTSDDRWGVIASASDLSFVIPASVDGETPKPGIWTCSVRLVTQGTYGPRTQRTGGVPVAIVPTVEVSGPVGDLWTVTGGPFQGGAIDEGTVLVYVGADQLTATDATYDPGEYEIVDDSTLTFKVPTSTPSGSVRLRILVEGAEAWPVWIDVP